MKHNIVIQEFTALDISEEYLQMLNSENKYSVHNAKEHTKESCLKFWEEVKKVDDIMLLITNDRREFLGTSRITRLKDNEFNAGLMLSPSIRGKGYGVEIWKHLLNYLESHHGAEKIYAGSLTTNKAMVRIMEKTMTKIKHVDHIAKNTVQFIYEK